MSIGSKIRDARLGQGLSQAELGGRDLTKGFICQIEHDKARPSIRSLRLISRRLGKSLDYFTDDAITDTSRELIAEMNAAVAEGDTGNAVSLARLVLERAESAVNRSSALESKLSVAKVLFRIESYVEARTLLEDVYESSLLTHDAQVTTLSLYWRANCDYRLERYQSAMLGYERVARKCEIETTTRMMQ